MSRSRKEAGILNIFEAKREATILAQLPEDWVALVERSRLDPGVPFEPAAIERFKKLRAEDPPTWARLRQLLKVLGVPVTELERQTCPADSGHRGRITQASQLLDLAERGCTLFHCGEEAFAEWAVACDPGMFDEGAFLRAHARNRKGAVTTVMEASPVAGAICGLMRKRRGQVWEGTATQLYRELTGPVDKRVMKTPGWPVNAQTLRRRLNTTTSALRPVGITVGRQKSGRRLIWLSGSPEGKH